MSADENGTTPATALPSDPAALEALIAQRREHLARTVDELMVRGHPRQIAVRGLADVKGRARATVQTPEGDLRVERVGAIAGALAVLVLLSVWLRRRRRS